MDEAGVSAQLEALWGIRELPARAGVLHVVATAPERDMHRVLKIAPHGPKSDTDFFLLNLARARADVIVTTGQILRGEPNLRYALEGTHANALHRWRSARGHSAPACVVILSSARALDLDHPAMHSWATPVVFTSALGRARIAPAAAGRGIEVVAHPHPTLEAVFRWARARGAQTVSVEAGPRTARALYAGCGRVDELWHSQFLGADLAHDIRGGRIFDSAKLHERFGTAAATSTRVEPSGPWRFSRYVAPTPERGVDPRG